MAKLEIPSIVVQSGSHTPPTMDRSTWSLSTQSTYEDECEPMVSTTEEDRTQSVQKEEVRTENPPAPTNNNVPPRRSKANLKLLKRSHAIKESTSPPPDISLSPVNSPTTTTSMELPVSPANNNNNMSCVPNNNSNGLSTRPCLKREGSGQSTDGNWSAPLSRGNSMEQQSLDHSGIDIEQFITDIMNKNMKDRSFLLRIENELVNFTKDSRKNFHKFCAMSSYQRMLVHRAAQYFGLEHNVDSTGQMVIVNKGKLTRLPDFRFSKFIKEGVLPEEPKKSILKRDSASFEDTVSFKSPDRHTADAPRRSKSFEEREEEYEKARRRIFHQEQGDDDYSQDDWSANWNPTETTSDTSKLHPNRPSRLTKVESYEGKDTLRANSLRSSVSKSNSFGGYDQNPPNARVLTKQDSGSSSVSSRVSPSSSGYKSQSQRSDTTMSATPSPTATPHLTTQLSSQSGVVSPEPDPEQPTVMWAVTSISEVPVGSVLINPQTGQAYTNEDGSVYHYDPENPPKFELSPHLPRRTSYQNGENELVQEHTSRVECDISTAPPLQPSVPEPASPSETATYHTTNHTRSEPSQGLVPVQHHSTAYQHLPPPPPQTVGMPPAPPPQMTHIPSTYSNSAIMYSNANPNPYNINLPPQAHSDPGYSNQQVMYSLQNGAPQYTPIPGNMSVENGSQDLCGYLMNLNIGELSRSESGHRPLFYCPPAPASAHPAHYSQSPAPGTPIYLAPANAPAGPVVPARYACSYPQFPPADRPGGECGYPQAPVHTYFSSSSQMGPAPNYYTSSGTGGSVAGFVQLPPAHLPTAQPPRQYHRMPTPPNTPQNGCPQYHMYSSTYSNMFNPPSQLPLPPLLRPSLQLSMCNSPPLRATRPQAVYNGNARSPVVREPDPQTHSSSHLRFTTTPHTPLPVYRFTYPTPNDIILLNAASRSTLSSSANGNRCPIPAVPARRQRPRPGGPSLANGRPASHQQAALATAIEAAGLPAGYPLVNQ